MIGAGMAFDENLLELLLGLILTFNVAAYSFLWRKMRDIDEETDKNSETLNMILHRVFGIEADPTDEGHIMETENRFNNLLDKLEDIGEKQEEACQSRSRMERNIQSMMKVLSEEDNIDVDESDFKN